MNVGIYIGRFQPLHFGHLSIISHMCEKYEHIVILVGSANLPSSRKNPFAFNLRKQWLTEAFSELIGLGMNANKISVLPLNDDPDEKKWEAELVACVNSVTTPFDHIVLVGHEKDNSSYYLNSFSQWEYESVGRSIEISATPIREAWFKSNLASIAPYEEFLTPAVAEYLVNNSLKYRHLVPS